MSKEDHKKQIGVPEGNDLVESGSSEWGVRKGRDTDTYYYDEVDAAGIVIAKYVVKDSTSTYPPFTRNITWDKIHSPPIA